MSYLSFFYYFLTMLRGVNCAAPGHWHYVKHARPGTLVLSMRPGGKGVQGRIRPGKDWRKKERIKCYHLLNFQPLFYFHISLNNTRIDDFFFLVDKRKKKKSLNYSFIFPFYITKIWSIDCVFLHNRLLLSRNRLPLFLILACCGALFV